ncbi:Hypothetical predicted protein [Pelobates cultripes]|uniref:Uncharacterized protein n=1 Tax=Pelobates cultripes TaxID=61616 RepID=A0AAD1T2J4_PELCU|nr:Hypothetical predicted protein [Pelobates cultripes]
MSLCTPGHVRSPPFPFQAPVNLGRRLLLSLSFLPVTDDLGGPSQPAVLSGALPVPPFPAPGRPAVRYYPHLPSNGGDAHGGYRQLAQDERLVYLQSFHVLTLSSSLCIYGVSVYLSPSLIIL